MTAFTGNPVTAFLATRAARRYVAEKYQDLDLTVGKAVYNFKMGSYMARAKSGAAGYAFRRLLPGGGSSGTITGLCSGDA